MTRPVLLVTQHPNIIPLWSKLSQDFDLCIVGPNPNFGKELGLNNSFPLAQFNSPDAQEAATNKAYELAAKMIGSPLWVRKIQELAGGQDAPEQLKFENVKRWWPAMAGEHIKQETLLVEMLRQLAKQTNFVGALVHEDVTPDTRTIVQFCKSRGIPTFHLPHANCFYTGESWDIHTESICDYILVAGKFGKDFYSHWGFDESKIAIVGSPALDSWYSTSAPTRAEARKVLGIGEGKFAIVYASTWGQLTSTRGEFDKEFQDNVTLICHVAKELGALLVVKMHPGEGQGQEEMYLGALKNFGVEGFVTREYNEYVLRAGDVLVSHGPSNVCVQAAIIGLPFCYLPTEDFSFPNPGPLQAEKTPSSLSDIIKEVSDPLGSFSKDYWSDFAKLMNDPNDCFDAGSASDRAVEFIKTHV